MLISNLGSIDWDKFSKTRAYETQTLHSLVFLGVDIRSEKLERQTFLYPSSSLFSGNKHPI